MITLQYNFDKNANSNTECVLQDILIPQKCNFESFKLYIQKLQSNNAFSSLQLRCKWAYVIRSSAKLLSMQTIMKVTD